MVRLARQTSALVNKKFTVDLQNKYDYHKNMNDRLNTDVEFIRNRLGDTIACQGTVADEWVWDELTLAEWDAKQAEFVGTPTSLIEVQLGLEMDVNIAASKLATILQRLHDATVTAVGLARVKFRKEVEFAAVIGALSAAGQSRQDILDDAEEWALAWEDVAPAWDAGMSLAAFEALRAEGEAALRTLRRAQVRMRRGAGRLRVLALEIEDLLQAWYGAATAIFPADTVNGEVVRSIKTTSDRPKKRRGRPRTTEPEGEAPAA